MEQLEAAEAEVARLEAEAASVAEKLTVAQEEQAAEQAKIDEELAALATERTPALEGVPEDLLKLYERLREQKGGIGAAELRARACGGCRITLDPLEIDRIRKLPNDEVVRCEECSRILVRTSESRL